MKGKTKEIAERLKGLRQLMDLSVNEMARLTDVSTDAYIAAEAGENTFSFTFLYKCAKVFGVEITELISGEAQRLKYYQVTRKGEGLDIEKKKEFKYTPPSSHG
jgi:transcriptional regulator with XRE-family HTH domain